MKKDFIVRRSITIVEGKPHVETYSEQELVRCKDCRYGQKCVDGRTTFQCFKWNCGEFGVLHESDWFCADGEKR